MTHKNFIIQKSYYLLKYVKEPKSTKPANPYQILANHRRAVVELTSEECTNVSIHREIRKFVLQIEREHCTGMAVALQSTQVVHLSIHIDKNIYDRTTDTSIGDSPKYCNLEAGTKLDDLARTIAYSKPILR